MLYSDEQSCHSRWEQERQVLQLKVCGSSALRVFVGDRVKVGDHFLSKVVLNITRMNCSTQNHRTIPNPAARILKNLLEIFKGLSFEWRRLVKFSVACLPAMSMNHHSTRKRFCYHTCIFLTQYTCVGGLLNIFTS